MTPERFFETYRPLARETAIASGIPAGVTLAQAALESGYGTSALAQAPHFNFFGVTYRNQPYGKVLMPTREYRQGRWVTERRAFVSYGSPRASFEDHAGLFHRNPVYRSALARLETHDVVGFVREMAKHYAIDPDYATKVLRLMNRYHLWGS